MAVFSFWLSTLNANRTNTWFKRLQLVSSAAFSIGHGGNDAQKVMGIITAALIVKRSILQILVICLSGFRLPVILPLPLEQ